VHDRLVAQGFEISYLNPEQMNDLMKRDIARWGKSLKEVGIKLD
jgi:tripartite-type tricarboxylate transporter receptor subunit TctC